MNRAVGVLDRSTVGLDRDPSRHEECRYGGAGRRPEDGERSGLRGHEAQPEIAVPPAPRCDCGKGGQAGRAVATSSCRAGRPGPSSCRRTSEHGGSGRRPADRRGGSRTTRRAHRQAAAYHRHDGRLVVARLVASGGRNLVLSRRDALQRTSDELDSDRRQGRGQLMALGGLVSQRLLDGQWLVDEVRLGSGLASRARLPARSASARAASRPAMPPPTIRTVGLEFSSLVTAGSPPSSVRWIGRSAASSTSG